MNINNTWNLNKSQNTYLTAVTDSFNKQDYKCCQRFNGVNMRAHLTSTWHSVVAIFTGLPELSKATTVCVRMSQKRWDRILKRCARSKEKTGRGY